MKLIDTIGQRLMNDAKRHEVLSGNIANAQTPGYKAKEWLASSFEERLQMNVAKTNARHLEGSELNNVHVKERTGQNEMSSLDGNNVNLDEERALLAQNALDLEAQIRFATYYLKTKQIAAS